MSQSYDVSLVLVVPASLKEDADRLSCAMGQDTLPGNTFSVPLSQDGSLPATHYGCHAWSQEGFYMTLSAAKQGVLLEAPPVGGTWEDFDLDVGKIAAILGSLVMERGEGLIGSDLFDKVLSDNDLKKVEDLGISSSE